jgi:anti-sigma factor RsiW
MAALNEEDRANLVAYLDGELDEAATQAMEARLNLEPQLRAEADALRQTWGLLDYLPKAEPSATFTNRTLERLSLEKMPVSTQLAIPAQGRLTWRSAALWAGGLVAATAAGLGIGYYLGDPGPDASAEADAPMIRHLRVAERWRYYENAEDLDFMRQLAQPDLFGEEPGS